MPLPPALRLAIEAETAAIDVRALRLASAELSRRYRAGHFSTAMPTQADRAAYLLTRLPATYAANAVVFGELVERVSAEKKSVLDLGSGPGTALWAAAEAIPEAIAFTAIERDTSLIETARRLVSHSTHPALRGTTFLHADLRSRPELQPHDIVVLSYSLGELGKTSEVVNWTWSLARVALVIIEPGTPKAFQAVVSARNQLIGLGAEIAAPCPHHHACPLAVRGDWCHFRARLERTPEHRRLKGGELGYEDEKFSYLIAATAKANQAETRIVRHPLKHAGHVQLTLCTPEGLQVSTVGKSRKDLYRKARNADWGDAWPESSGLRRT